MNNFPYYVVNIFSDSQYKIYVTCCKNLDEYIFITYKNTQCNKRTNIWEVKRIVSNHY